MTPDDVARSLSVAYRELTCAEFIDSTRRREQELTYWSGMVESLQNEWFDLTTRPMPGSRIFFRHKLGNVKLLTRFPERLDWERDVIAWRFEP